MSRMGRVGRAARRVSRWVSLYTRGLPPAVAAERRAELESDVYEQVAHGSHGHANDRAVAREIAGRAVRGIPADLLWRDSEMRRFRMVRRTTMTAVELTQMNRLSLLLYLAGGVVSAGGLIAAIRATVNVSINGDAGMGVPLFWTAVLAVVSLGLILRPASRAAGVGLLAVSSVVMNWFLLAALPNLSSRAEMLLVSLIRPIAEIPRPMMMVLILVPSLALCAALVLILRKLHRIEQRPVQ